MPFSFSFAGLELDRAPSVTVGSWEWVYAEIAQVDFIAAAAVMHAFIIGAITGPAHLRNAFSLSEIDKDGLIRLSSFPTLNHLVREYPYHSSSEANRMFCH